MRSTWLAGAGTEVANTLALWFAVGKRLLPPTRRDGTLGLRRLIVNADDLGLTDGVTEGIVKAWREGVVTSTSALINVDGGRERIADAHARYPDMPIGLHLNITSGRPVLPPERVPSLVDRDGCFYRSEALLAHLWTISLDELRQELGAQAELLLAAGVEFDHIDYHEGMVMVFTPFYDVVRELACAYRVPVRQPVPESVYAQVRLPGGGTMAVGEMVWFGLCHPTLAVRLMHHVTPAAFHQRAAGLGAAGVAAPDWFIDLYFNCATPENFISMLRQLPPGTSEVAVHPAIVDERLHEVGGIYVEQRAAELNVVLDPRVRQALADQQIALADFTSVGTSAGATIVERSL